MTPPWSNWRKDSASRVLETATTPGTLVQLPYKWDERDPLDSWEAEELLHPSLV